MTNDHRETHRRKRIIGYEERIGNVHKTRRYFGVARSTFYLWRERYLELDDEGLRSRKCCPHNHPNETSEEVIEKILHLRRTAHMGPIRIVWCLERHHAIKTSDATVYPACKRHGLNRLPSRVGRRAVHTHRYEKQVPGHQVQVDVRFLTLQRKKGVPVRRYRYNAIDDATRVRALKIYRRHTQANAIDFIDYVVERFPFPIRTIRTDRGHEFQALFHWHVADLGLEHVYIKPRTPQLNGKVERPHRTDKHELYQLLTYRYDVDLDEKLAVWERFYNYDRPPGAHRGNTLYEALREKLRKWTTSGLILNITVRK
jgi:transposase InsO family protein